MGRKYGRLAYGRYSYDLWPAWYPIPPPVIPGDIWVPTPDTTPVPPPPDMWVGAGPPASEFWVPTSAAPNPWGSSTMDLTEIWKPVTKPTFGLGNG